MYGRYIFLENRPGANGANVTTEMAEKENKQTNNIYI